MLAEQAFILAIREHEGLIHKVCILYEQEQCLREDLYQEIILNAWKGISSFRGDARFSTWLYRVAINTAISSFRKSKRSIRFIPLPPNLDQAEQEHSPEPPEQQLYTAIGGLSKLDKALVMLYLDNYSYLEISELLGISENHIAVKMARIKKRLRNIITAHKICG